MKEVKSIKFNFIMNLIRVLMTIVFPLITYPYATRVLNSAGVGRAAYVASIVSYFQLVASFGVNNYAITEGAKIRDDKAKLNKFASEMFLLIWYLRCLLISDLQVRCFCRSLMAMKCCC